MLKRLAIVLALLAVAASAAFVAAPGLALRALRADIEAGDHGALAHRVDFPALRSSLTAELTRTALAEAGAGGGAAALVGGAVGQAVVAPVVDRLVTPEGVAALLRGRTDPRQDGEPSTVDLSTRYRGLARFEIVVAHERGPRVALLFRRRPLGGVLHGVRIEEIGL